MERSIDVHRLDPRPIHLVRKASLEIVDGSLVDVPRRRGNGERRE
jgi:hypothetical protein